MKYCENCGAPLHESAQFCTECGTKIAPRPSAARQQRAQQRPDAPQEQTVGGSGNIKLCPDGKLRWIYELPMMKNPVVLITVLKVLALAFAAPALLVFFSDMGDGIVDAFVSAVSIYIPLMGIAMVLALIAYTIVAATYGFKYIVLFTMDDDGVVHAQQAKQFGKAEALGWLTAFAGSAANSLSTSGAGMLAATKSASSSEFRIVRSVIGKRGMNTIKVNQLLEKNQVYVYPEDYDFVWDYITSRCTNAKKIK